MVGVQLGSNVGGALSRDQEASARSGRAIAELNAAVFVHPVNLIGADRLGEYFLANLIGNPVDTTRCIADVDLLGASRRLSGSKICFAHAGGAAPILLVDGTTAT